MEILDTVVGVVVSGVVTGVAWGLIVIGAFAEVFAWLF